MELKIPEVLSKVPGILSKVLKLNTKSKKLIAIILIIIVAGGGVTAYFTVKSSKASKAGMQQLTATVQTGDISKYIEASGPIGSASRKEIASKVTSTIDTINFKEGDEVKKGDVMFTLDDTDAMLSIEEMNNNIATTQIALNDTMENVASLNVKAPFSGEVTAISLEEGDEANAGGTILTITDTSKLKLTVPFSGNGVKSINAGHSATVYFPDLMSSLKGTITYISSKPYTASNGNLLYTVEIAINNPGSLIAGTSASAEINTSNGTLTSTGTGTLKYSNSKVIKNEAGGTAVSVNVKENQYVSKGDILVKLENENLKSSLNTTQLKLKSLQSQLEILNEKLGYYTLTAPCDGTITSQDVSPGDTVSQGNTVSVVSDMKDLQFEVSIDELDIGSIALGQKVSITADALEETTKNLLSGEVKKISAEGTSSNGVTTYPVTISVTANKLLKTGMNVNGKIMISSKENVLIVPLEAVQTDNDGKSYVYVKSGKSGKKETTKSNSRSNSSSSGGNSYYAGTVRTMVTTGVNDDTNIEISNGLTEGQIVILPKTTTNSSSASDSGTQSTSDKSSGSNSTRIRTMDGPPGGF